MLENSIEKVLIRTSWLLRSVDFVLRSPFPFVLFIFGTFRVLFRRLIFCSFSFFVVFYFMFLFEQRELELKGRRIIFGNDEILSMFDRSTSTTYFQMENPQLKNCWEMILLCAKLMSEILAKMNKKKKIFKLEKWRQKMFGEYDTCDIYRYSLIAKSIYFFRSFFIAFSPIGLTTNTYNVELFVLLHNTCQMQTMNAQKSKIQIMNSDSFILCVDIFIFFVKRKKNRKVFGEQKKMSLICTLFATCEIKVKTTLTIQFI